MSFIENSPSGTAIGKSALRRLDEVFGRNSPDSIYTVRWTDGHASRYPFVWLFDNCRCPQCYAPSCYQRLSLMKDLDPEVKPLDEKITNDGALLQVKWPNGHIGEYPSTWLHGHQFDHGSYDPIADIKARPWGSELAKEIPRFQYNDILQDDDVLFRWLTALHEIGFALITDAPTKTGCMEALGKRVAYLRQTNYGHTFQVHTKNSVSSLAFTTVELGLHVDLCFYDYCPGVQMLHCIRQTKTVGGENQFSDALHAALILKKDNPKAYKLLKTVHVSFRNCGSDDLDRYHYISSRPMIEEDGEGHFKQIYYNDHLRASYLNVPVEEVQDVYRAMKLFHQILNKHTVDIKLREGDIATFNNTRVMHGRNGYVADTINAKLARHYEGGYLDWDEIHSRMRVLREENEGEQRL